MGVRSALPLNSLASIGNALSYPIDGTEVDIQMTADHVLVAFHDSELSRETNCSGSVYSSDFKSLEKCVSKTWLYDARIARLEDILSKPWEMGTVFSFDLKVDPEITPKDLGYLMQNLTSLIDQYSDFQYLIESPDKEILNELKSMKIDADLFYYGHGPLMSVDLALENGWHGVSMEMGRATPEMMETAHQNGLLIMLWGAGSAFSNRELLLMRADIIQTDHIPSMVRLLGRN
jgi:glycerophosphoryl diester phosphodiesterase